MDRITLLDALIALNMDGEIVLEENKKMVDRLLQDIKRDVEADIRNEILRDITNLHTGYYAPDFDSWKQFLNYCNGYADYEKVLDEFSEDELEELWQVSHITEPMTDDEVAKQLILQIKNRKMLEIVGSISEPVNEGDYMHKIDIIEANIRGLYNIIFE